ncbi:hypothetical protein C4J96_2398 [Pseudomonas orientalis]|nr:hypothetical protein C4J96_2398 [Pseudomonas orientalis]
MKRFSKLKKRYYVGNCPKGVEGNWKNESVPSFVLKKKTCCCVSVFSSTSQSGLLILKPRSPC